MLVINHMRATCRLKSESSGPARVSTRLAIGLLTHGTILICSPKNRSGLLDTFFRNPCILVPDTETQSCKWCCSRLYKRGGKGLVAFTRVRLGFHSPQRSAKVSGTCACTGHTNWQIILGGNQFSQGDPRGL